MASLHTTFLVLCVGGITYLLAYHNAFYQWHWVWGGEVICLLLIALCVPQKLPSMLSYGVKSVYKCAWGLKNFPSQFKWGLAIIALHNLQATAIAFHWSDFAIEKNIPLSEIYKLFLPIAILELVFNPISSWMTRTIKFTVIHILSVILILLSTSIACLSSLSGRCSIVILFALGWSFNHVLSYSLPALLLPKKQMPLGFAALIGWTNLCSALGPYLYSLLALINNSYAIANNYIIVLNMLVWIPIASRKEAL
jgi:hypothetical protein